MLMSVPLDNMDANMCVLTHTFPMRVHALMDTDYKEIERLVLVSSLNSFEYIPLRSLIVRKM